jgi:hypothetical protein
MLSSEGIDSLTIAAAVTMGASVAITVCPATGGFPLELVAVAVTVTGPRGVVSLVTTTNTTVPVGVGAAAVATTVGSIGVDGVGAGVADGLVGAVAAPVDLLDVGAGCEESQAAASIATGMSRPSQADELLRFN